MITAKGTSCLEQLLVTNMVAVMGALCHFLQYFSYIIISQF